MQKVMQVVTRAEQVAFKNGRPEESPYMKLSQSTREYGRAIMDASHEYACDNCDSGFETESYMYACRYCYIRKRLLNPPACDNEALSLSSSYRKDAWSQYVFDT